MFHHTVLLCLEKTADTEFLARMRKFEAAVRSSCKGVVRYHLVRNEAATRKEFEHALFSAFESYSSFVEYDRSALHDEIKAFLRPYIKDLVVADGSDEPQ